MAEDVDDPHYFEFDLDEGIRAQVVKKLEASPLLPLEKGVGPTASGIYALYYHDKLGLFREGVPNVDQESPDFAQPPQRTCG